MAVMAFAAAASLSVNEKTSVHNVDISPKTIFAGIPIGSTGHLNNPQLEVLEYRYAVDSARPEQLKVSCTPRT